MGDAVENKETVDFNSQSLNNSIPNNAGSRNYREITASIINKTQQQELAEKLMSDKSIKKAAVSNQAFSNVLSNLLAKKITNYKCAFVTRDSFLNSSIYVTSNSGKREKISASFSDAKAFVKRHMPDQYISFIKSGSAGVFDSCEDDSSFGLSGISGILSKLMGKVKGPGMFNFMNESGTKPVLVIKIKAMNGGDNLMGLGHGGHEISDISDAEAIPSNDSDDSIKNSLESISPDKMLSGDNILPESNGDFLEPITVNKTMSLPFGRVILGETKQGGDMFVGIILSKFDKSKLASDYSAFLPKDAKPVILNSNAKFYKLAGEDNDIITNIRECMYSLTKNANIISVINRDSNSIAIKTASEAVTCDKQALPYFLASFGIKKADVSEAISELNSKNKVSFITPKKASIKLSNNLKAKLAKVSWVKAASYLDSEESVDSALALEYLDEGTVSEFYDQVPVYRKALNTMAKLMASVRLGNEIVSEETLKNAMEALDTLITELTMYREGV